MRTETVVTFNNDDDSEELIYAGQNANGLLEGIKAYRSWLCDQINADDCKESRKKALTCALESFDEILEDNGVSLEHLGIEIDEDDEENDED